VKPKKTIPTAIADAAAALLAPYFDEMDPTELLAAIRDYDRRQHDGEYYTVAEFAELLRVHPESVYRMIREKRIPFQRLRGAKPRGRHILIPASALERVNAS